MELYAYTYSILLAYCCALLLGASSQFSIRFLNKTEKPGQGSLPSPPAPVSAHAHAHTQPCSEPSLLSEIKNGWIGLPWWRSGWESACQCRGHGFEPWSGKIPHAAERLGPWATIAEPVRLEPVLHNKRGRDSERPAHCDEEWPPLAATGESPHTETKTQHSQK